MNTRAEGETGNRRRLAIWRARRPREPVLVPPGPRLRVLQITPVVPAHADDRRTRMLELLSRLGERHQVDLLTLTDRTRESRRAIAQLRAAGVSVEGVEHTPSHLPSAPWGLTRRRDRAPAWSAAFGERLADRLATGDYDIVHCEATCLARLRPAQSRTKWVLDVHDVDETTGGGPAQGEVPPSSRRFASRAAAWRDERQRRTDDTAARRRADHLLALSDAEAAELLAAAPGVPVTVAPNGVDLAWFRPRPVHGPDDGAAVVVGRGDDPRQRAGVRWFCTEVLPLVQQTVPTFRATVVDPHPDLDDLAGVPGVVLGRGVPDIRQFLWSATVAVVPARATGGAQPALLETLASGLAAVVTPQVAATVHGGNGEHLVVARGAARFADEVVDLLGNPARRSRMGRAARSLVERHHGWDAAVDAVDGVWRALCPEPVHADGG